MYEEFFGHFGLKKNPFHVSPNPHDLYSTPAHDEALLQLVFGIESRRGLLVLTGEPGTGKTTILQYLLDWLKQYGYSTAYVFQTLLPSVDLLQLILRDFGILCSSNHKSDLLSALEKWLLERQKAGDCPVIVIDEAQALSGRALDDLRLLLKLQNSGVKLVQLVLAGHPKLEEMLQSRKLARLRQRVMQHCKLPSLSQEETSGYILSRLQCTSGAKPGLFPPEAVREIFRYSKGIPRVINLLCEHALLMSYADRREIVTGEDIQRVARQFDLDGREKAREPLHSDTFCRLIPFPGPERQERETPKVEIDLEPSVQGVQETVVELVPAGNASNSSPCEIVEEIVLSLEDQNSAEDSGPCESREALAAGQDREPEPLVANAMVEEIALAVTAPAESEPARQSETETAVQVMQCSEAVVDSPSARAKEGPASTNNSNPVLRRFVISEWQRFVWYWRAVGKSIVRDGQQFWRDFQIWLSKPVPKIGISVGLRRRIAASVMNWLRTPFGSQAMGPESSRASAAAKHL